VIHKKVCGETSVIIEFHGRQALQWRSLLNWMSICRKQICIWVVYYDNKDYKKTEPFLLRASDGAPKNPQILLALANTQMKNGELDQSLLNAQKVHSLPDHKQFAMAHLIAAQILSDRGKTQAAAEEYPSILARASRVSHCRSSKGRLVEIRG
jgi:tetratricopeptide (TPR) repeat protein